MGLPRKCVQSGFTLLELMITVAVVALLAILAAPVYSDYITRSRIPEATSQLATTQVAMERWFQDNRTYVGASCPVATAYFSYRCDSTDVGFRVVATGRGGMSGFSFTLDEQGTKTSTGPQGWGGSTTCWIRSRGGVC